jgi:hypothetical protein
MGFDFLRVTLMRTFATWLACICLLWLSFPNTSSGATYAPGIPEPVGCLNNAPPAAPTDWPEQPSKNFYYIDNTSERATDDDNPFGSKARPRLTIPQGEFAAGTYVELHGGPYTTNRIVTVGLGTAAEPVWIRGESPERPVVIRAPWYVAGHHVILEHVAFDSTRKTLGIIDGVNICIRHNRFSGPRQLAGNSSVISVYGRSAGASKNNVIYSNEIRDFGDAEAGKENDYHGILVGGYTESTWIIDNDISGNSGDAVQVGNTRFDSEERPRLVYIARNRMHDNRENAVDVKRAGDVIVSSNEISGYEATSSSEGAGIVIHSDPEHIWIVNNVISDSNIGIITTGSADTWFVGNVIHDIAHSPFGWDPESGYASGAAMHFRGRSNGGAVANTVVRYDVGLQLTQGSQAGYAIHNNIFAYRRAAAGDDIRVASGSFMKSLEASNNLIFDGAEEFRVTLAGRSYLSSDALQSTGLFRHTLTDDPEFVDPDAGDFSLTGASPAIGAGIRTDIDDLFHERYGIRLGIDPGLEEPGTKRKPVMGATVFRDR